MVTKMAVVLITIVIKMLMISCNNYDESDINSGGNIGDKPNRFYVLVGEVHTCKQFCASAELNQGYSAHDSHLRFLVFTHKV